jgi:hypothetical protein
VFMIDSRGVIAWSYRNVERMCARGWLRLEPDNYRRSHLISG